MYECHCEISIVESNEEFLQLQSQWASLETNFFLSWEWMYSWWESIGQAQPGNRLCLIKMECDQQLVGIAPMYVERSRMLGRTLKFLASGTTCSDMMQFPSQPQWQDRMAQAVLETIQHPDFAKRFGRVDLIELEGHFQDEPTLATLIDLAQESGFEMAQRELEGCWRVPLPNDWDGFRKVIKKSQRRKVNKVTKLMDLPEFEVEYIETSQQLEEAWPVFVFLHQKRRQELGQSGCFAESKFNQFLHRATQRLMERGQGLLTMVKHQGKPLGAILCFQAGDCLCVYQSGLDPDMRKFEPGHFANTMTLQEAVRRGYGALDFLRGDESYKAGWGCERTPLFRTRLVAPRFSAQIRHRVLKQSRQLKQWSDDFLKWSAGCWSGDTSHV